MLGAEVLVVKDSMVAPMVVLVDLVVVEPVVQVLLHMQEVMELMD